HDDWISAMVYSVWNRDSRSIPHARPFSVVRLPFDEAHPEGTHLARTLSVRFENQPTPVPAVHFGRSETVTHEVRVNICQHDVSSILRKVSDEIVEAGQPRGFSIHAPAIQ